MAYALYTQSAQPSRPRQVGNKGTVKSLPLGVNAVEL